MKTNPGAWISKQLRFLLFAMLFVAVATALARADEATRAAQRQLSFALAASDVNDDVANDRYTAQLVSLIDEVRRTNGTSDSRRDQSADIMSVLHRRVLMGTFDPQCDSVAATLDGERYNCVTATILFCILAHASDLPVSVLHGPEHVWAQIDGDHPLTIETTNGRWLSQPLDRLQASRPGRTLTFEELCAKLVYNRGLNAIGQLDFPGARDAFARALELDPRDAAARQNLLAALNNGAIAECREGDPVGGLEWLAAAERIDPAYPPLARNRQYLREKLNADR